MPTSPSSTEARTDARVRALYHREARRSLFLAALLRFLVLSIIVALTLDLEDPPEIIWLDLLSTVAFVPVGIFQLLMVWRRIDWAWPKYLFILADIVLLTVVLFTPWPGDLANEQPALVWRDSVIGYHYVLLLLSILYLSAWALVWFAACSVVAWFVTVAVLVNQPGVLTDEDMPLGLDPAEELAFQLQPSYVHLDLAFGELILLVLVALGTAVVVARMRAIAMSAARAERRRGNLARYFSPTVLDELEHRDRALGEGQQSEVAILFADLRGFTTMTETLPPPEVLALLRGFHGAMEEQVFAYGGSLEKYIGDALMVSFGTPVPGRHDASHAYCCAQAMSSALLEVNARRRVDGHAPVAMGIGLHYGPVVTGDIGSERNMAFVTVGASVNLASRVQGLTRDLDCEIALTADFESRLRREVGAAARVLLAGLSDPIGFPVKGFAQDVMVRHDRT